MRQIRQGVFETNSSSTHSFTVYRGPRLPSMLEVDDEGFINLDLYGFCSCEDYVAQHEKLSYILQLASYKCGFYFNEPAYELKSMFEEFYEEDEFLDIQSQIIDYVNETNPHGPRCIGIRFKDDASYGYIDDASDYSTVEEFLEDHDTNLIDFVFGNNKLHYEYNG